MKTMARNDTRIASEPGKQEIIISFFATHKLPELLDSIEKTPEFNETVEIFGSYARCGQTSRSDIDLLVTYSEAPDVVGVNSIKRFLRRKLGVKVDIVSKKYLNPLLKDEILKEAIPV